MSRDVLPPHAPAPHAAVPPRLADTVRIEPAADGGHWLVSVDGVPVSRASSTVAATLRAMDGAAAVDDLRRRFAPDQEPEAFAALVERFRRAGLLEGAQRRPAGRLTYRPPLTIQLATLRAPLLFDRLLRLLRPLLRRWLVWPLAAVVVLGVVALLWQAETAARALTAPLPLVDVVLVAAVMIAATVAHEAAHGVTLSHAGARPRRAGVILLYLGPAFFVDVTDAWRLPSRASRVAVALAGPAVHAVLGGAAALGALAVPDSDLRRALLVVACTCGTVVVVNLVPFVRFDGYVALMSALDEPRLRARTMDDAADALRRVLFGGSAVSRAFPRRWSVPFGVLSALVPAVIVWLAVERTVRALAGTGPVGAFLVLALQAFVVIAVGVRVARWLAACWRRGRGRVRFVLLAASVTAVALGAAAFTPVDDVRTTGFVVVDDRVLLVSTAGSPAPLPVADGTPVDLSTSGILSAQVATGTARATALRPRAAPLSAFSPVEVSGVDVDAVAIGAVDVAESAELPAAGRASLRIGSRSALEAAWTTHVVEPASVLLSFLRPPDTDTKETRQ
ncbi:putative peptide zinc metalloprotease protein [Microbacterium proteolyticum]|uniref:Putative peptide zinc metalloprotease protein n=1 Tax=Microbacterium proteolyticum TaxID=1572644 RepID=A0A7W5CFT6_9MICO|nr:daptide biosynthesis intramembrane metalloprotease [Microbacterium proteolyticum]MBB3156857.1 putative peptide zinc metalloprotease protein [Microbacterium proteolyticum]